jgi:hypothetical protein
MLTALRTIFVEMSSASVVFTHVTSNRYQRMRVAGLSVLAGTTGVGSGDGNGATEGDDDGVLGCTATFAPL